jgi:hypothetical protein
MLDGLCLLQSERAWSRVLEVVLLQPLPSLNRETPWRSLGFAQHGSTRDATLAMYVNDGVHR